MTLPAVTASRFTRSLAFRWVALVTFAASLGVAVMLLLTTNEMATRLGEQSEAITVLAQKKTVQRIDVAIKLVEHRLRDMVTGLEDDLSAIASSPSMLESLRSRSDGKISAMLGNRLRRAGFSGGMIIDHRLAVVGTDKSGGSLLAAQTALGAHDLKEIFRELIENNDRRRPSVYRFSGVFDASHAALFMTSVQDKYGSIIAYPIFDPFGDAAGVIVAYRTLRKIERPIREFAETTSSAVVLMVGNDIASIAGPVDGGVLMGPPDSSGLFYAQDKAMVGRCALTLPKLTACVLRNSDEITQFSEEIMAIGIEGSRSATRKLAALAALSLVVISVMLAFLSRRLTRPLSEITEAVERVANGEWRVEVQHAGRPDEIGMIARAVAGMQISLIERDRMRQEMVRIDAINQRRLVMDKALSRFETGMGSVMQSIAGTLVVLNRTNDHLGNAAREAEAQATLIVSSTEETAFNASAVSGVTLKLSENIAEIGNRVKNTNDVVHRGGDCMRETEEHIVELTGMANEAQSAISLLQQLAADLGKVSLKATIEAAGKPRSGKGFAAMADSVQMIALQSGEAADLIAGEITRLGGVADRAASALREAQSVLGDAVLETSEIAVVVAEQNAATREIASGLAASGEALVGLTNAVETLRQNIASAHGSTSEFVAMARKMVEDAKLIDDSVRSFIREVAA